MADGPFIQELIDLHQGMTPEAINERCAVAIQDVMRYKAGETSVGRIDNSGNLRINTTLEMQKRGMPQIIAADTAYKEKKPKLCDTKALVVWLDHDFYDPNAVAANMQGKLSHPDKDALADHGIKTPLHYATGSARLDLKSFTRAVKAQVYFKSGRQLNIPIYCEWLQPDNTRANNPPSAVILMTDAEHQEHLFKEVFDVLHETPKRTRDIDPGMGSGRIIGI